MNFLNISFVFFTTLGALTLIFGIFKYLFQVLKARLWTIRPFTIRFKYNDDERKVIFFSQRKIVIGIGLIFIGSFFNGSFLKYLENVFMYLLLIIAFGGWTASAKGMFESQRIKLFEMDNDENRKLYKRALKKHYLGALVFVGIVVGIMLIK